MKNKFYIRLLTLGLVALFLNGCLNDLFDQKDQTFQGDPQLEFRPRNETAVDTAGAVPVPLEGADDEPLKVQLIGEQRSSDLSVSFEVDTDNSTAVAGTHYNLVTSSPITLPANSSSTNEIEIDIIEDSVPDGEVVTLVLVLQDSEGVEAAENLKTYTLTIEGYDDN